MGQATASTIAVDVEDRAAPPPGPAVRERPVRGVRTMRGRMARILALPLAAVVLLLGLVAAGPVGDYRESQRTTGSVDVALGVRSLVVALQDERGVASLVLGGNESFTPELARVRETVEQRRGQLTALVVAAGESQGAVRSALQALDGLAAVRAATDSGAAERRATFDFYTARIAELAGVDVGLEAVSDRELARSVALLAALQDAAEATAQERALLSGVFSAGGFRGNEFVEFAAMRAAKQAAWDRYFELATSREAASARYLLDTGAARVVEYFEQVAVEAADGRDVVVNPQTWWSAHTTVLGDVTELQDHVGSAIRLRAFDLQREATRNLAGLVGVVLVCLVGSIYLAVLASQSVSRPLALLAAEAETVADERLPAAMLRLQDVGPEGPVDPSTLRPAPVTAPRRASAEIRSVVTALNHLQDSAYRLAVEQAVQRQATLEALTNLGRRNQNLVRKQLRFISNLEKEEMDPTGLANLFELDHLATRMRRNAASLLVLTGSQSPGQWTTPAPIVDVMRAAVSEVEDYRRVALRRVDETLVSGAVVGSLAHLLSELVENGLRFSPPDCEVELVGRQLGDDYLVAVVDQGIGMTSVELEEANARLRGEGDFMVTPSRFLGHYVVGRLAEQAGVRVELLPSPVTGVTARIHVPAALLVRTTQIESGQVVSATDHLPAAPADGPPALTGVPGTGQHVAAAPEVIDLRDASGTYDDDPDEVSENAPDSIFRVPAAPAPAAWDGNHAGGPPTPAHGTPLPPVHLAPPPGPPVHLPPPPASHAAPVAPQPAARDPHQAPYEAPHGPGVPAASAGVPGVPLSAPPNGPLTGPLSGPLSGAVPSPSSSPVSSPIATPVGSPAGSPAGQPAGASGADARTRNGLKVRVPGSTRPATRSGRTGTERPEAVRRAPAPVSATPVEDSAPGRIGGRLSALRSGMQRGFDETGTHDAVPADGNGRSNGTHREEDA